MQYLQKLDSDPKAPFYEILGEHQTQVKRYVVSTRASRAICNQPEITGVRFTCLMREALVEALSSAPFRETVEKVPERRVCVLSFLRGGLNFDLRGALNLAYGMNDHCSAFMSSQRFKTKGRWDVKEDMYRKLKIPDDAVLMMGDVVATGVTIENGFRVLLEHLDRIGSRVRLVVFFTIGCHKLEKYLAPFDELLRKTNKGYQGAHAVYLEGKLKLVDSRTSLRVGIAGTDLIRKDCLLAPEFEESQYDEVSYPLERCAIYDAGSRAFDPEAYLEDVTDYWGKVRALARGGLSLFDALKERWPEEEYGNEARFYEAKRMQWRGVDPSFLARLHERYMLRWTNEFRAFSQKPQALEDICMKRLQVLGATPGE